jgi:hypothetical protein
MTTRITAADWLDERRAAVPPRLAARLDDALPDDRSSDVAGLSDGCVKAADALLRDLLRRGSAGRDVALDLLTVDALVTYAFEAASDEPSKLRQRAAAAAARFAAAVND